MVRACTIWAVIQGSSVDVTYVYGNGDITSAGMGARDAFAATVAAAASILNVPNVQLTLCCCTQPNRAEILVGGLRGVVGGLERLKNNRVSAAKLVVRPQEMP